MKNIFVMLLLCCVCMAEEKTTLPLPDPGSVTLTLDEYNRLVELAAKPPKKSDVAPLPYSVKHADVKLHVENDGVRGTVEIEGEVFRKGVSKVPLTSGMTVLDAHQNGKGVALLQENGTHMALLPGPGEFSVDLDTGLPLRIEAGRASFTLPAPAAGSVQLALVIPGDHTFAYINPGIITSRKSENGHTAIEATMVPGQPANIWWATREAVTPTVPREVRFLSDTKTLVSVSEAEMRLAVLADVTIVRGEPSQFQVELPAGYEVTGVTGATLDSTETNSGVLTLKVNAPAQRSHQFLISLERSISDSKADAPFLTLQGSAARDRRSAGRRRRHHGTHRDRRRRLEAHGRERSESLSAFSGTLSAAGRIPLSQAGQRDPHSGTAMGPLSRRKRSRSRCRKRSRHNYGHIGRQIAH